MNRTRFNTGLTHTKRLNYRIITSGIRCGLQLVCDFGNPQDIHRPGTSSSMLSSFCTAASASSQLFSAENLSSRRLTTRSRVHWHSRFVNGLVYGETRDVRYPGDEERILNKRERLSSSTKMGRSSGEYLQRSVGPRTYLSGKWAITQQSNKYSDAKSNIYFTKMSPFLIGTHCSYIMIQRCPRVSWLTKESRTPENIAIWPGKITQHCQWNKHRTAKMIIKAIQTRNNSVLVGYRLWGEIGYKGLRTLGVRKQRFWDGRTSQDRAVICKYISKTTQAVKHAMVWLYAAVFDWTSWLSWVFHTMSDSSPYLP